MFESRRHVSLERGLPLRPRVDTSMVGINEGQGQALICGRDPERPVQSG